MDSDAQSKPKTLQEIRAEIARLKTKRAHTDDPDIRQALKQRIEQLEAEAAETPEPVAPANQVAAAIAAAFGEDGVPPEPTPEQLEEADKLIQFARVEKMRNNGAKALEFMQKAAEVAPGSPTVLEMLGDDYAERRQFQQAQEIYKKALSLAPKNVSIEKKLALAALRTSAAGSVEDQLRRGSLESPFLTPGDAMASARAATIMSFILPGSGQLVLGQTAAGLGILIGWVASIFWLFFLREDIQLLFRSFYGGSGQGVNLVLLIPAFIALALHLTSITMAASVAKRQEKRGPIERPRPPADLPFE